MGPIVCLKQASLVINCNDGTSQYRIQCHVLLHWLAFRRVPEILQQKMEALNPFKHSDYLASPSIATCLVKAVIRFCMDQNTWLVVHHLSPNDQRGYRLSS
jgi:hypothetical protein